MILPDANVLLYAYDQASEFHERARAWLEATFSGPEPVRLAWVTILAFVRIATNPRAFHVPLSTDEAAAVVSTWLALPSVGVVEPSDRHWEILSRLLQSGQVRSSTVTDAHLAALGIEHGATLCSTDRDFTRFEGLRLANPLANKP